MTIRRRLVVMSVTTFIVVLIVAGAGAMSLLRSRLVDDLDESLLERGASLERLAGLVSSDLVESIAEQRPQIAGADVALIALSPDDEVAVSLPSGPLDAPDPLPDLGASDIDRLRTGSGPFTVAGGTDGYRVAAAVPDGDSAMLVLAQPLDDVARTMRRVLLVLLVAGVGAAVVLGGALGVLIRRELQPLDAIADTADRITDGQLSQRVPIGRSSNEMGRLGGALNSMLGRIEEAVAARTESENKMRRFVADASHELRTPLTSIRGYAELYRAGADSPDHVARSFDRIEQETKRMGGLVDDLVLLARLDQERPFTREPVDLAHVVCDAATDARAIDPDRQVTVVIGDGTMVVDGDAERLRQVVANLLNNVRTHTEPGTAAAVSVLRDDDAVAVAVADEGSGMNEEAVAHVFERFYQASPDRTTPGSGLGLAIVRSIVERHGGTVEMDSAPGHGTTVTLRIPAT